MREADCEPRLEQFCKELEALRQNAELPFNASNQAEGRILNELASCKNSGEGAFTLAEVFSPCRKVKLNFGFTLAEVLITLGIIGVVAALTIPSLVASYRKQETVASLKKFYSTFNNAILLSEVENGDLSTWEYAPPNFADHESMKANDEFFKKYLFPYFKGIKICNARDSKCNSVMSEVLIQGKTLDLTRYIFADGACIAIFSEGNLYNRSRLSGYLDINCSKKPNKPGSDQFLFHITLGEKGKEYIPFWYGIASKRDRDTIKQMCKDDNFRCGALIQIDNWNVSKDYPVKF